MDTNNLHAIALGWLTAWIKRAGLAEVNRELGSGYAKEPPKDPGPTLSYDRFLEPFPIRFLRDYGSVPDAAKRDLTGDTLAAVAIYLRNLLLNQTLLAAAAIGALATLQLFSPQIFWKHASHHSGTVAELACGVAILGAVGVFMASGWALWCVQNSQRPQEDRWPAQVAIGSGVIAAGALWILGPSLALCHSEEPGTTCRAAFLFGCVLQIAVFVFYKTRSTGNLVYPVNRNAAKWYAWVLATTCSGAFCASALHWMRMWLFHSGVAWIGDSYAILGIPAWLALIALLTFVQVGILGDAFPDAQREWLARMSGYYLAIGGWVGLLLGIALLGPLLMQMLFLHRASAYASVLTWVLPGGWLFTVVGGLKPLSWKSWHPSHLPSF